ncbi:CAP domain-containing protein [Thalassovita sp.]|uniref:CAP domain-containing protein n=1 Tax=Thalassovita sp. TaxID=1979401 RepID=UPI002B275A8D|nr:CAP domain-containing protein [Thalassovita sp.]
MATPTAVEQELLELINRARSDPSGEFDQLITDAATGAAVTTEITFALDYFSVDLDLLRSQLAAYGTVAPLAWNDSLSISATDHSELMIQYDSQEHQLPGEASLLSRIVAAGYSTANLVGENIYAYAYDAVFAHAGFYIDWGYGTGGMQDPAGHRITILSANYTEVGISALTDTNPATAVGPLVVTQDFGARSDYQPMLVGAVIQDGDGDAFYDAGEGLGGISVWATDATGNVTVTTSWDSGGFQMELNPGTYTVSFRGGVLTGIASYQVVMGNENVHLYGYYADAVVIPPVYATGDSGADSLAGAGGDDSLDGGAGDDTLDGGDGNDTILGGLGDDYIIGGSSSTDLRDVIYGGDGDDFINGGNGNDELYGDAGMDTIIGGFGVDTIVGGTGDDQLTGEAWSDLIFGGDGNDFINGGFGYDRVNGGAGADRFFHLGIYDHGSDWIQDYTAEDGDVLLFGRAATREQFQINLTETANAGVAGVEEAFVIYRPTGQIMWALVDGGGQDEINIVLNGTTYDLLT